MSKQIGTLRSGQRLLGAALLAGIAVSCPAAAAAEEWISLEKTAPVELFGEKCGMCHRAGGMGTGILERRMDADLALLENRRDLQPVYIETAVRAGIGIMFPISRAEVSDAQLQVIVDHLVQDGRR